MSKIEAVAAEVLRAYETARPIPPVAPSIETIDDAYAVQLATVTAWQRQGRSIGGRKIGLTSKAVQTQLGVDQPDFGVIMSDMILSDGASVPRNAVLQPRVEAELAFVLRQDLVGEKISPDAVIAATDYVVPALEICGSRIQDWKIGIRDTIADNASSGLVVLGTKRFKPILSELPKLSVVMTRNGVEVSRGVGQACLENPAFAVSWLAETLTKYGANLRAGDVVMSGALCRMEAAAAGDRFEATFGDGIGNVQISFAE